MSSKVLPKKFILNINNGSNPGKEWRFAVILYN